MRFPLQPTKGVRNNKVDGLEVRVKESSQADSAVLEKGLGSPSMRAPANQALTSTGSGVLMPLQQGSRVQLAWGRCMASSAGLSWERWCRQKV